MFPLSRGAEVSLGSDAGVCRQDTQTDLTQPLEATADSEPVWDCKTHRGIQQCNLFVTRVVAGLKKVTVSHKAINYNKLLEIIQEKQESPWPSWTAFCKPFLSIPT